MKLHTNTYAPGGAPRSTGPSGRWAAVVLTASLGLLSQILAQGGTVYDGTSAYHHIQVVDQGGLRLLSFDGAIQSRMALATPLLGHFEYTEFFHLPWLWKTNLTNALMVGLGGGSIQRAYRHYYPTVMVETVELDPMVLQVAQRFFGFAESSSNKVHVQDGRLFLRNHRGRYGVIIMDAYTRNRYGAFIPYHLATKEFFEVANAHLADDGVLAYNVISTWYGKGSPILGAVYQTLKAVFPEVYACQAQESLNVVLLAVKGHSVPLPVLRQRARELTAMRRVNLPTFVTRAYAVRADAPPAANTAPVLTDDYAPVDGLLQNVPAVASGDQRRRPAPAGAGR